MKVLFVDTSEKKALVSVIADGKVLSFKNDNGEKTHATNLLPIISGVLLSSNLSLTDIDIFGVANGPGSYTGLRIAVSTVATLAFGVNKPVVTINTLDYLANSITTKAEIVVPMIDARNTLNYWKVVGKTAVLSDYAEDIANIINRDYKGKKTCFVGSGAYINSNVIIEKIDNSEIITLNDKDLSISAYNMVLDKFNDGTPSDFIPMKANAEYFKEVHVTVKAK